MKKLVILLLFPVAAFALTEKQFAALQSDDTHMVADVCHEDSFLRNCYKADAKTCLEQSKKSYDGCIKFLKKSASAKISPEDFQKKIDSCLLREVGHQWKENVAKRTPACALPPQEAL